MKWLRPFRFLSKLGTFLGIVSSASKEDFEVPDSGRDKSRYACNFFWGRLPDGRMIGGDLVRSDDTGKRALRFYLIEPEDGTIRSLIYEAPSEDWEPFVTESKPALDGSKPVLGRGRNWIAGAVQTTGQDINRASFNLDVLPTSAPEKLGELGVAFTQLNAQDYLRTRIRGWVIVDGETFDVDSEGLTSVHYGTHLPSYGWGSTIPDPHNPNAPQIFFSSMRGDNLRVGKQLLHGKALTYAYGQRVGWRVRVSKEEYAHHKVPLGGLWLWEKALELSSVQLVEHELLGVHTITATAEAALCGFNPIWHFPLTWFRRRDIALGRIVLDFRGTEYLDELQLAEGMDRRGQLS